MTIQSVKRATDIISLFSSSQAALGITQIAANLGLNKTTAWGLVNTLEQQGFLQQNPETLKYSVGPRLFELGMLYIDNLEINSRATRHVHALASRTRLVARLGIWDRRTVLITLLALPKSEDSLSHQIGPRIPAYCSGIGKALLANLDKDELQSYLKEIELVRHTKATVIDPELLLKELAQVREQGYAVSCEEMIPGLVALGAPVFGKGRRLVGAISISDSPASGFSKHMEKQKEDLLRTATEISQEMGYYSYRS